MPLNRRRRILKAKMDEHLVPSLGKSIYLGMTNSSLKICESPITSIIYKNLENWYIPQFQFLEVLANLQGNESEIADSSKTLRVWFQNDPKREQR